MEATQNAVVSELAQTMVLGALLARARERWGAFEILDHWQQGEFHHDVVLRVVGGAPGLPGGWIERSMPRINRARETVANKAATKKAAHLRQIARLGVAPSRATLSKDALPALPPKRTHRIQGRLRVLLSVR